MEYINRKFNDLNYNIFFLTIEDAKIIVRTDYTFVMPKNESLSQQSYTTIHHHTDNELFFITDGELLLNLETDAHVYKDCIVHIPAFTRHFSKAKTVIYRFMISFEKRKSSKNSTFYDNLRKFFSSSKVQTFNLSNSTKNLLKELDLILKTNCIQKNIRVSSLLTCIILELLESNKSILPNKTDMVSYDYVSHLEYILNNVCNKDVSLTLIANELSLSTKQVSRIIKKNYHSSLTEVVNEKKISAACLLLKNTTLSISKIIELVNIKTENYFYTLFKKHFGISPLQYRKLHLDK